LPSWGFAPPRLSPPSPLRRLPAMSPSCPSTGSAPYGPHPGGASGVCLRWKRRCLSRGCQPSWGFAPFRCRSAMRTSDVPGLMVSPRPKGSSPEGSLWEVVRPTGVRGTDRLGASVTPDTRHRRGRAGRGRADLPLQSLAISRNVLTRVAARQMTPATLACVPGTPAAGSAYLVPRSPFAFLTAVGVSRRRACMRFHACGAPSCASARPWSV